MVIKLTAMYIVTNFYTGNGALTINGFSNLFLNYKSRLLQMVFVVSILHPIVMLCNATAI